MPNLPTTLEELDELIHNEVQEGVHLDYKESPAIDRSKRHEIAKDVSAFANSDGGVIIYGIIEDKNLPVGKDMGVDHTRYSREWIEQVISSNITPRIDDILISSIPASATHSYYAIKIPKSFRGPHQAPDKKYYKRFNFQSVAMEDYEINDIRNRQTWIAPLIDIRIQLHHRVMAYLAITNIGDQTAENVLFELPDTLSSWMSERKIKVFTQGIKYLPPKKSYTFVYGHLPALLNKGSDKPAEFDITVSYKHPRLGQRLTETFHIDLMDHWGASSLPSEIYDLGISIKEALKALTNEVNNLNRYIAKISTIAGATGLDLSISTLRNLKHVKNDDDYFEKLNPMGIDIDVFMEILGVDFSMAARLSEFFWNKNERHGLREISGMTEELLEKITRHFILEDNNENSST